MTEILDFSVYIKKLKGDRNYRFTKESINLLNNFLNRTSFLIRTKGFENAFQISVDTKVIVDALLEQITSDVKFFEKKVLDEYNSNSVPEAFHSEISDDKILNVTINVVLGIITKMTLDNAKRFMGNKMTFTESFILDGIRASKTLIEIYNKAEAIPNG